MAIMLKNHETKELTELINSYIDKFEYGILTLVVQNCKVIQLNIKEIYETSKFK